MSNSLYNAVSFIWKLPKNIKLPNNVCNYIGNEDEDINLTWENKDTFIDVSFLIGNLFSCYARHKDNEVFIDDKVKNNDPIDERLLAIFEYFKE